MNTDLPDLPDTMENGCLSQKGEIRLLMDLTDPDEIRRILRDVLIPASLDQVAPALKRMEVNFAPANKYRASLNSFPVRRREAHDDYS